MYHLKPLPTSPSLHTRRERELAAGQTRPDVLYLDNTIQNFGDLRSGRQGIRLPSWLLVNEKGRHGC